MSDAPLAGLKVLDFSHAWAGPLATRMLADMGAEVLKVESPAARGRHPVVGLEGLFDELNRNKRSIALDLSRSDARDLLRKLVEWADVVLDNFSARVMSSFGFDHVAVREMNPNAIVISMPAYGLTGPHADSVGVGSTIEAAAGLSWYCRYRDMDEPQRYGPPYPDAISGLNAVFAILFGLLQRDAGSGGTAIDLSQIEATVATIGELVLQSGDIGELNTSLGDRHSQFAPWTSVVCGDERWLFVGIESDEQWRTFASIAEIAPSLCGMTTQERFDNLEAVEAAVGEWASNRTAPEAELFLQAHGVPAAVVLDAADLMDGPAASQFVEVGLAAGGSARQPSFPLRWADAHEWESYHAAPRYGGDLRWALRGILGLDEDEIGDLIASGTALDQLPGLED